MIRIADDDDIVRPGLTVTRREVGGKLHFGDEGKMEWRAGVRRLIGIHLLLPVPTFRKEWRDVDFVNAEDFGRVWRWFCIGFARDVGLYFRSGSSIPYPLIRRKRLFWRA